MNVKTSTWFYGVRSISIHKAEPHSPNQRSFSVLNVRHSLSLLTTTQYGHYIVKVSKRCDLSTCTGNCVFAVTTKVLFSLIPQKTSTSFSVRPKLSRFLSSPQTRLAIEGERNT